MSRWTTESILAAASAWVWVPPDARQVHTAEYQVVDYPDHYYEPGPDVAWSRSDRPAGELIGEVAGQARTWGRADVRWRVGGATRPPDTEAVLLGRGAELVETSQVLAFDMTGGLPALDPPAGVRSEIIRDEAGLRAGHLVDEEVWGGGREPADLDVARRVTELGRGLQDWSSFQVVAFADGQPASFGGCALVDGVARLWGAGTRAAFRGRGSYRAVLARRLAVAREHGATLALVKGRVQTSAPILRRAGFRVYGEERCYRFGI